MEELFKKLAKPAQRALQNHEITSLRQLAKYTEAQVANWHGIGPNALRQIKLTLEENGTGFAK